MKNIITLTDQAQQHIESLLEHSEQKVLLVSLNNKGCSGHSYEYTFSTETQLSIFDEKIQLVNGVLAVKANSVMKLLGSTLDVESSLVEQKFKWKNPQVTNSCGCGKSVSF